MNAPLATADLARLPRAAAFEALYQTQHGFVWRCAQRLCVDEAEVDDVVQDVFVIAYRRIDQLDPDIAASTWLFGILRNVARNRVRGQGRHHRRLHALAEVVDAREHERCAFEARLGERLLAERRLAAFLRELDPAQREVFVLAELEGYTAKEIAATLDIKSNTASSRLRLARRAFCRHFELEPRREAVREVTSSLREHPIEPSPEVRAQSWGLLLAAVARPLSWSSSIGGLLTAMSGKAAVWVSAGVLSASVLIGTWAAGGAWAAAEPSRTQQAAAPGVPERSQVLASALAEPRPAAPDALEQAAAPSHDDDPPLVIEAPDPRRQQPRPRSQQPPAAEQLRQARAALVAGDPSAALRLLDAIPETDARLLDARVATRIAAQCKLGDQQAARASFESLQRRMPEAAVLTRIDHACW